MKQLFFTLSICLFSFYGMSQESARGYYITNTNDTIRVEFIVPVNFFSGKINYEKMQDKIKYYDSTEKKQVLRPDKVKKVVFSYYSNAITTLASCVNDDVLNYYTSNAENRLFLRVIKDGKLRYYVFYKTEITGNGGYMDAHGMPIGGGSHTIKKHILQKNNEAFFYINIKTFGDDMVKYLSDCPDFVRRLYGKEFKIIEDVAQIVEEYNKECN